MDTYPPDEWILRRIIHFGQVQFIQAVDLWVYSSGIGFLSRQQYSAGRAWLIHEFGVQRPTFAQLQGLSQGWVSVLSALDTGQPGFGQAPDPQRFVAQLLARIFGGNGNGGTTVTTAGLPVDPKPGRK